MKEPSKNTGRTITRLNKNKNNVTVFFNQQKLTLSFDVAASFYLYKGKTLTEKEYQQLLTRIDNEKYLSYAMKLASSARYSEFKMREKLYSKEADKKQVDEIIATLKKNKLIDDKTYIEDYIEFANRQNFGKNKIIDNLLSKGIFRSEIDKFKFDEKTEINKAKKWLKKLEKKYSRYNGKSQRDHIIQALIREGFDLGVAVEVTTALDLYDSKKDRELLKKDYQIIKKRYQHKYSGHELNEKIKQYLYHKGYRSKDIDKIVRD